MPPKSDFQINYEAISKKVLLRVESEKTRIRNDKCKQPSNLEGHIFKTRLFCKIFLKQDYFIKLPENKVQCQDGIYNF